ncbi:HdeD family acid-resistance protein [Actinoplanes campanulatus]|uniref:HdeD family acid-resistance protein n=1 Tax=Actinoplanes campanulatus TaxID=113559 RepID=UPI001952B071|nr:DUF308 domain-containing protein [Actinoplanes capillaceus]
MTDVEQTWPDPIVEVRRQPFPWWTLLITGLLAIALGLTVLIWPDISLRIMVALTGIWLFFGGLAQIIGAFLPTGAGVARSLLSGIVGVIVLIGGLVCLRNLVTGLAVLAVIFATTWILSGLALLLGAATAHGPIRAALIIVGALSMIIGIVFVLTPSLSLGTLVLLTGAGSLLTGLAEVGLALYLRRSS